MSDTFEEVGPAVGLVIFLAVVFFWVIPEFLHITNSETSPFFSYIAGILVIILFIIAVIFRGFGLKRKL